MNRLINFFISIFIFQSDETIFGSFAFTAPPNNVRSPHEHQIALLRLFRQQFPRNEKSQSVTVSRPANANDSTSSLIRNKDYDGEIKESISFVDQTLMSTIDDLSSTTTKLTDKDILERVTRLHASDYETARASPLRLEERLPTDTCKEESPVKYEWLPSKVAIQSLEPVLNATEIKAIRFAADAFWKSQQKSTSRFTYQYPGNSEVHLADLNHEILQFVNRALREKLYPLVRAVFLETDTSGESFLPSRLFVYDALVIRYNATASDSKVAGQPLHRDLGLVSINIMLNDNFEGGGTYFDNQHQRTSFQGVSDGISINKALKPSGGPGFCLAHYSHERHAGAGTISGVRDILVLFISVKDPIPRLMCAHLKQASHFCDNKGSAQHQQNVVSILCRIRHQRLAVEFAPDDGEAFLYLGTALMDYAKAVHASSSAAKVDSNECDSANHCQALIHAIHCFEHASCLTPNDARVYNNWGIALTRLDEQQRQYHPSRMARVQNVYQKGLDLLLRASEARCSVGDDIDSLSLNYGLFLANRDHFGDACQVLSRPASKWTPDTNSQIINDAHRLWVFCKDRV
jgi:hypothetical protein